MDVKGTGKKKAHLQLAPPSFSDTGGRDRRSRAARDRRRWPAPPPVLAMGSGTYVRDGRRLSHAEREGGDISSGSTRFPYPECIVEVSHKYPFLFYYF
jgi:hypothetical protein